MSYEGYVQALCSVGHYYTFDACAFEPEAELCSLCRGESVWRCSVDQTNHRGYPMTLVPRGSGKLPERPVQGHIYHFPTEEEMRLHRAYAAQEYASFEECEDGDAPRFSYQQRLEEAAEVGRYGALEDDEAKWRLREAAEAGYYARTGGWLVMP